MAAGRGDTKRVAELLKSGADAWAIDSKMGVSILHKAVYSGNAETVELLIQKGSLIDLPSPSNGNTPLHDAVYFKSGDDARVIKTLLAHNPNLFIRNRAGLIPLESAKVLNDKSVIGLLEDKIRSLFTPAGRELMDAVKKNEETKVQSILARGEVPVEESDEQGFTPLLWAARQGYVPIVKALLAKGASPNHLDQWMRANAGHKAAFWGHAEVMTLLIQHGLDLNAKGGYNGYTALHDAVARGHLAVVKVLLNAKARIDVEGHDGKLPIDLARAAGNAEIVKLLGSTR